MAIETVLDFRAAIGESATWVADEGALYWIDVKAPALHRYCPHDESTRSWPMTSDIGGFALTGDGGAVVALRLGLFRLDLDSGALQLLAPPPFDPALFRFNEGACDANGRFWIGVMFDPLKGSPPIQRGRLHSFTFEGGLRDEPDAAELHNGMAWSGDGKTFFVSHSNTGEIFVFDYEVNGGMISNRRVFATVSAALGIPDGAAIDAGGRLLVGATRWRQAAPLLLRRLRRSRHRLACQSADNARFRGRRPRDAVCYQRFGSHERRCKGEGAARRRTVSPRPRVLRHRAAPSGILSIVRCGLIGCWYMAPSAAGSAIWWK
jgi:sugar lactone lactonase YvrE